MATLVATQRTARFLTARNIRRCAVRRGVKNTRARQGLATRIPTAAEWLQPVPEQQGLRRYLDTLRERSWIIGLCVIVAVGAAIAYLLTADEVYEARADVLITPVPATSETLVSLGLIRESNDPSREVDTAAQLVTTFAVAERVSEELGGGRSPTSLLDDVEAEPVAQSNIVAVTGQGSSPTDAAELANAFAEQAIAQRTDELHDRIDDVLPALQRQLEATTPDAPTAQELAAEIAQLETLRATDDPTMTLETPATPPSNPSSPRVVLTIVGAALLGLVLGLAAAFAMRVLDPRLRREEQLGALFRLPVLARIPRESFRSGGPLTREQLSAPAIEAYRTLRATLTSGAGTGTRSILVTGPSAGGGKTTTALHLATSLITAGHRVILIEADVRRPSIARALGIEVDRGLVSVLLGDRRVTEALGWTEEYGPSLGLLLAEETGPAIAELVSLPVAKNVIDEAAKHADYVIVDSPPLTQVIDALPLAAYVDDVLLVVRLGQSHLRQIKELGELLAGVGVTPAGVVIVGVPRRERHYYSSYFDGAGGLGQRASSEPERRRAAGESAAGPASGESAEERPDTGGRRPLPARTSGPSDQV
jgi:polysaccharide biosynthesis transport protein